MRIEWGDRKDRIYVATCTETKELYCNMSHWSRGPHFCWNGVSGTGPFKTSLKAYWIKTKWKGKTRSKILFRLPNGHYLARVTSMKVGFFCLSIINEYIFNYSKETALAHQNDPLLLRISLPNSIPTRNGIGFPAIIYEATFRLDLSLNCCLHVSISNSGFSQIDMRM